MKHLIKLVSLLLITICNLTYCEDYSFYAKSGLGYIISQPSKFTVEFVASGVEASEDLYYSEGDRYSHSFEAGMNRGNWNMGIAFTGLIDQGESRKRHKPYKLELFSDYRQYIQKSVYTSVGFGLKIHSQEEIYFDSGYVHKFSPKERLLNKLTARIGVFKAFNQYEVGIIHHSHWFVGSPFNNDWEYHKTEIVFNKYFF